MKPRAFRQRLALLVVMFLLAGRAGVSGLAAQTGDPATDGFAPVVPGEPVAWPDAFHPHPDHRLEWWYLTANLKDENGNSYGVQWTLFRTALWPGSEDIDGDFGDNQIWFAHSAATSADRHYASERWVRGGLGLAGIDALTARIDDWHMTVAQGGPVAASGPGYRYDLTITDTGPAIAQGAEGYSLKSRDGNASYYLSKPFITLGGTLVIDDKTLNVEGNAWLDREWSSALLSRSQTGWDWFALSLDSGDKLMLFRVRGQTPEDDFIFGTRMTRNGTTRPLPAANIRFEALETSPYRGGEIPTLWRITLVGADPEQLVIKALNPDSVMDLTFPYWEGPVEISGSETGRGYLEMTGYAQNR